MDNTRDILLLSYENNDGISKKRENILQIVFNSLFILGFYGLSMYFYYYAGLGWNLSDCFYFVTVSINL